MTTGTISVSPYIVHTYAAVGGGALCPGHPPVTVQRVAGGRGHVAGRTRPGPAAVWLSVCVCVCDSGIIKQASTVATCTQCLARVATGPHSLLTASRQARPLPHLDGRGLPGFTTQGYHRVAGSRKDQRC